MKLIFVLAVIFGKVSFIDLFEIVEIVRAFRIHTFMDDKVFSALFRDESIATVWATHFDSGKPAVGREASITYLA